MPWCLILSLALIGQKPPDTDQYPLALQRSMEIDDLDREILRLHDTVLLKRGQLEASKRLAQKGLVSRGDLERESAELRKQEASEAEAIAYRAFKCYERDVRGMAIQPDEQLAYTLLLNLVRKQLAIARVDLDYRAYMLNQTRALFRRKAVSPLEMESAELAHGSAEASVSLSQSRESQILMELSARLGEKPYDPAEYHRLKTAYLKARVHYFKVSADGARRRLDIARERARQGLIPSDELKIFERAVRDSQAPLAKEIEALKRHEAEPPVDPSKRREVHAALRSPVS
ncbi:MAG: hypothetical protein NVSMB9_24050 [Isosphaeraceae bacterium]